MHNDNTSDTTTPALSDQTGQPTTGVVPCPIEQHPRATPGQHLLTPPVIITLIAVVIIIGGYLTGYKHVANSVLFGGVLYLINTQIDAFMGGRDQ